MFITSARNVVGAKPEFLIKNWITGILKKCKLRQVFTKLMDIQKNYTLFFRPKYAFYQLLDSICEVFDDLHVYISFKQD